MDSRMNSLEDRGDDMTMEKLSGYPINGKQSSHESIVQAREPTRVRRGRGLGLRARPARLTDLQPAQFAHLLLCQLLLPGYWAIRSVRFWLPWAWVEGQCPSLSEWASHVCLLECAAWAARWLGVNDLLVRGLGLAGRGAGQAAWVPACKVSTHSGTCSQVEHVCGPFSSIMSGFVRMGFRSGLWVSSRPWTGIFGFLDYSKGP